MSAKQGLVSLRGAAPLYEVIEQRFVGAERLARWGRTFEDRYLTKVERPGECVLWKRGERPVSVDATLADLADLPFYQANVVQPDAWQWERFIADKPGDIVVGSAGFNNGHWGHGWAVVFKGPGHEEIGDRRLLAEGPWRVLRDEGRDLTWVQFCDPLAEPVTRGEQAQHARARMGYGSLPIGIYFSTGSRIYPKGDDHRLLVKGELRGIYEPELQRFTYVVPDGKLHPGALTDLCWLRFTRRGGDAPIARVRVQFYDEAPARKLHRQVWLRGFEAWAYDVHGRPFALSDDDLPPPVPPPDWVRAVQDREGR